MRQPAKRLFRPQRLRESSTSRPCPPRWVWFLVGVLVGIFGSFVYRVKDIESTQETPPKSSVKADLPAALKIGEQAKSPAFEFDFPTVLSGGGKEELPYSSLKTNTNDVSEVLVSPVDMKVLQVGSFKELQSAEGLKNHLNSLGIQAFIQPVTLSGGELWHRVRVGPFKDFNELNQMSTQLSFHNVPFDVLKW